MPKVNYDVQLIKEVLKSISNVGIKETIKILRDSPGENLRSKKLIKFVISIVSKEFKLPSHALLYGTSRFERTDALAICFYLLDIHGISRKMVSQEFNKSPPLVSLYIKKFKGIKNNVQHLNEKQLMQSYEVLHKKVTVFINKYSESNGEEAG